MSHNNNNEPVLFPILNHIQNDLWQLHSLCYPTLCKFHEAWFQNKAISNQQLTLTYFDKIFFPTYSIEIKFTHQEKENCTRFKVNLHSIVAWKLRNSWLEAGAISEAKLAKWLSVRFRTKCLWVRIPYQSLKKNCNKEGRNVLPCRK